MSEGRPLSLSPLRALVSCEEWAELTRYPAQTYLAGRALLRQGDKGTHVLALVSGLVKVVRTDRDGRQRLLAFRGPGEILGEMALQGAGMRMASVWAMSNCKASIVSGEDFRHLVDNRRLAYPLAVMSSRRLLEQAEIHDGAVHERLAVALLRLVEASDGERSFDLTREDLALHIGVGRKAVSKALEQLGQDRVEAGKGRIDVIDVDGLREIVDSGARCAPRHSSSGPAAQTVPAPTVKLETRATAHMSAPARSPRGRVGFTEE
ncbi:MULTISPECIES: Crp/Fnr family transcriptional regulator [unclassified Streptomyces]|uniref:Crp/Fnr family transcriptional regulator n=1 Tax=unclassified Streptomyces TaxID=2593676 RepID=UPI000996BA39|nr:MULTISPECIES: Crp/Fnr family transcriptional regulator [unclassified Streptomyces]MYR65964.1 cyclic nucleotide-binding domain-containing protein [Streptomyces sp. SID4939]MYR99027.1 cyclic nucleotide-binding domain-containing protein [Streptomyces sp. SID4940]MYT63728.1 cyclic nucleotide-binding domain-containing protein [Streptomyces sp. SID8357]MYT85978.1 cyclic nucleotide-binding domain-containing protein [Streptomyces sp. SID8360]MYW38471.1 cyclic nucleotide-binding domain-containing pr